MAPGYQDKCLKAEENLKQMQESNKRESASLQLLVNILFLLFQKHIFFSNLTCFFSLVVKC